MDIHLVTANNISSILKDDNFVKYIPSTRYQGSKRRILPWIYNNLANLEFRTVLDGFGGTGSVGYLFKLMGKEVTVNDAMKSNYQTGVALIENSNIVLTQSDTEFLLQNNRYEYPTLIQKTFKDIYYYDSENRWLDMVIQNIKMLSHIYEGYTLKKKKALAYHALFQACLCKRPFNLFHRKNLNLRKARMERSFGNRKMWNKKFSTLFKKFVQEETQRVFSNGMKNKAICKDIMLVKNKAYDLIYLDPPYTKPNDNHPKNYYSLYHFLEGLVNYESWLSKINWSKKNRCLRNKQNRWENGSLIENFGKIFAEFRDSIIVVSYGTPGYPSIQEIKKFMLKYKSYIRVIKKEYSYKLNLNNGKNTYEVLIVGT